MTRLAADRTQLGLVFLAIGFALGWIPLVTYVGDLLAVIGAILVIIGRAAFGDAHSRNVGIAVLLYIVGIIITFVLGGSLVSSTEAIAQGPAADAPSAFLQLFNNFFVGAIAIGILTGLATVFFLWSLLGTTGKVLIWASFFATLAVILLMWAVINGQIESAVASAFAANPPDPGPLVALVNQLSALNLLKVIPDLLAAAAASTAWSQIKQGILPRKLRPGAFPSGNAESGSDPARQGPPPSV